MINYNKSSYVKNNTKMNIFIKNDLNAPNINYFLNLNQYEFNLTLLEYQNCTELEYFDFDELICKNKKPL
jgi:hypothetical protein